MKQLLLIIRLVLLWCLASTLGWGIGSLAAWLMDRELRIILPGIPWYGLFAPIHLSSTMGYVALGVVLGLFQSLALRSHVRIRPRFWIFATTFGWFLESLAGGATLHLGFTLCQWWLLRKSSHWAWVWPLFGAFGATSTYYLLGGVMKPILEAGGVLNMLIAYVPIGTAYGLITGGGLVLIFLTRHLPGEEHSPVRSQPTSSDVT